MATVKTNIKCLVLGMVGALVITILVLFKVKWTDQSNTTRLYNEMKGLLKDNPRKYNFNPGASVATNVETYQRYAQSTDTVCNQSVRMGSAGDGGWDVCIVPPFNMKSSCMVYDFGIDNVWTFDDAIAKEYGCNVRAFDPYCNLKRHERSPLIQFYPIGLSWTNVETSLENPVTLKTLRTLMNELDGPNVVIDYLKIDIEYNEWTSLITMFKDGFLPKQVKQLGIEVHLETWPTQTDVEAHMNTLHILYDLGFRKWKSHINPATYFKIFWIHNPIPLCHEMYYINTNFKSS